MNQLGVHVQVFSLLNYAILAEVSTSDGRVAPGNNLVLGGDGSEEAWRELDRKVC